MTIDISGGNPQYLHKTGWLNHQDGFLVLDKNLNGTIDNAEEMFSNAKVAEPLRGLASLATWDGNGDNAINANDPIYSQLYVWKDADGDGRLQASEVQSLGALGISSLNYGLGTFTQNGQTRQMNTLTLQAETAGNSYTPKPDGIQVTSTNGQSTLYVSQVYDLSSLQANEDGLTTEENVPAVISVRGNGAAVHGLLDNDHVIKCSQKRSCLRPKIGECREKRLWKRLGDNLLMRCQKDRAWPTPPFYNNGNRREAQI